MSDQTTAMCHGGRERALLREPEVAERDDGVAVAPGGDVFLVEQVADAALVPAALRDPVDGPRLALVARGRDEDVWILRFRADEAEPERCVVRVSGVVERNLRVAGRLI